MLFAEPDLLLLDEPTNYLDLEGTLWLQDHLARYPHTVIVISHDRDLLDNAVDQILSLEAQQAHALSRRLFRLRAPARASGMMLDQKMAKKQEAQRKHLQAFVDRFRAKATRRARRSRASRCWPRWSRSPRWSPTRCGRSHFPAPDKLLSPPIIAHRRRRGRLRAGPAGAVAASTLRIDNDDRIALLGANGNGKSTLVKLLAGRLAPMHGHGDARRASSRSAISPSTSSTSSTPTRSAYDHVRELMPDAPEAKVRAPRRRHRLFRRSPPTTPVENLSGGEKARLLLGLATFGGAASAHPRRADQPSRHRQPRRADRGDQRLSRAR